MQEAIHRSYIRWDSGEMPPCGQPKPSNVAADVTAREQDQQRHAAETEPGQPTSTTPPAPTGPWGSAVPYGRRPYLRTPCDHLVLPP